MSATIFGPAQAARKAVSAAISDPGATEGLKGDRTSTEWQTDAVMRALYALPQAGAVSEENDALHYAAIEAARDVLPYEALVELEQDVLDRLVRAVRAALSLSQLLGLSAAKRLKALSPEARSALAAMLKELRDDARNRAQVSWRKNKGPMAVYWKAVGAYCNHLYRVVRS